MTYSNLSVYAPWNILQHLSATEIALKMGTGSVWWHQKWWKWNFLEFPHPETSLQFYVLWVEICTRGDLQASVSFCCWFLKLLPFLECLGFTSLLLWQMWQRAQTQDLCSALCSGPGIPCDGRQFIHGFCNSLPTCKGTCWQLVLCFPTKWLESLLLDALSFSDTFRPLLNVLNS